MFSSKYKFYIEEFKQQLARTNMADFREYVLWSDGDLLEHIKDLKHRDCIVRHGDPFSPCRSLLTPSQKEIMLLTCKKW